MDREIATVAEKRHGVFTYRQALAAGLSTDAIKHRVQCGRWERVSEAVYRLPGTARSWEQRLSAVTLAAGPLAAASHRSAAGLLGLPGFARTGFVEVSTPRSRRHRQEQARVHRCRVLPDHHLTVIDGIPTTRVARTLVDLAAVLHPDRVERAVDNCLAMGIVTLPALGATFAELATRGRAGIAAMRRILDEREEGYVAPASELEARFVALVRSAGLPEPVRQLDAGGAGWVGRVDFAYPATRLLIELDSRRHHTSLVDRRSDERRDQRLLAAGWRVARITWTEVATAPGQVVTRLLELLRADAG